MKGSIIPFGTKISRATGTGANADVVVTLGTPESGGQHVLDWINVSSDTASSSLSALTVATAATVWKIITRLPAAQIGHIHVKFPQGLELGVGSTASITFAANASYTGELNVGYR